MASKGVVPFGSALREMKRDALLRAAVRAFSRDGFHATSLEDIGRKLGVTKAALYYYFPSKNALLAALLERAMEFAFGALERARREGRNGRERLRLTLQGYIADMVEALGGCVLLTEESALLPTDRRRHIQQRDAFEHELRTLVADGIADGSIVRCDLRLVVFAMLGAINWVPKWFSSDGAWNGAQVAEALSEYLDRALSTEPAGALCEDVGRLQAQGNESRSPSRRTR